MAEKQVMLSYLAGIKTRFAIKQRQQKLEEQLAGRRMRPKKGFKVGSWVEVRDKNKKWFEARITAVTPTGYQVLRPGEKKSSYIDSQTVRPT